MYKYIENTNSWISSNNKLYNSISSPEYTQEEMENLIAATRPIPDNEEIKSLRARAYRYETDGITAEISRLRDEEPSGEITEEINRLISLRAEKVAAIKQRYPYS